MADSELRHDADGRIDDVVLVGVVHLERMDVNHWWIGVDGRRIVLHMTAPPGTVITVTEEPTPL